MRLDSIPYFQCYTSNGCRIDPVCLLVIAGALYTLLLIVTVRYLAFKVLAMRGHHTAKLLLKYFRSLTADH
jgi:preprotein translocase subunit Sec61beta